LNELVSVTNELNGRIEEFVNSYKSSRNTGSLDTTNSGDQRHFFTFPDTEQFKCSLPRPAENLIFENGTLSIYDDSDEP